MIRNIFILQLIRLPPLVKVHPKSPYQVPSEKVRKVKWSVRILMPWLICWQTLGLLYVFVLGGKSGLGPHSSLDSHL